MIKFGQLPENIIELLPGAAAYLEGHPKTLFGYLFGSLAGGTPLPLSDVDIAVYLVDNLFAKDDKLDILGKLMEIHQTDEIDLVILNTSTQPTKTVCGGYFDTKIKTQRSHLDRISSILTFVDRLVKQSLLPKFQPARFPYFSNQNS